MKKISTKTIQNRYFKICSFLNVHIAMEKYYFSYSDIIDDYYFIVNCVNLETLECQSKYISLLISPTIKRIKEIQAMFDINYEGGNVM